jgi:hypothetical protein
MLRASPRRMESKDRIDEAVLGLLRLGLHDGWRT